MIPSREGGYLSCSQAKEATYPKRGEKGARVCGSCLRLGQGWLRQRGFLCVLWRDRCCVFACLGHGRSGIVRGRGRVGFCKPDTLSKGKTDQDSNHKQADANHGKQDQAIASGEVMVSEDSALASGIDGAC